MSKDTDTGSPKSDKKTDFDKRAQKTNINKLIMGYLVTEGFKEVAEKFQQASGIPSIIDWDAMDNRIKATNAVKSGNIEEAINIVNQSYPELLAKDKHLNFHLQQLQLVEIIRKDYIDALLSFARSRLVEFTKNDPMMLHELERTISLIAFEEPLKSPFHDVMDEAYHEQIASDLNMAMLKMERIQIL